MKGMKVLQILRSRMRSRGCTDAGCNGQDLVLYRHLRRAENNLHTVRDSLAFMRDSHKRVAAEHKRAVQAQEDIKRKFAGEGNDGAAGDERQLQTTVLHQQDCARQLREFKEQIDLLTNDLNRLEMEYQSAQMNVRRYFYLKSCPGSLQEAEAMSGQPAQ